MAGATTNSQSGVTDVWKMLPVFKAMADLGVPLLVHGEVTDASIDVFDREEVFIRRVMVRFVPPCFFKTASPVESGASLGTRAKVEGGHGTYYDKECSTLICCCLMGSLSSYVYMWILCFRRLRMWQPPSLHNT